MSQGTQRKLAAIVSADVAGYSRLMGVDEIGTLEALRSHRTELIDPLVDRHGGRIVKTMGDGLLLEFPSVVEAAQCAIEVQDGMASRNTDVAADKRIVFRIGVNLGDIIIDGDDILGDGVNIAARLQEIAEPGGVAISRRVHEDVRDRLEASFEDFGEQMLKNIARPIQVWRWSPAGKDVPAQPVLAAGSLPLPDKPSIAVLPFDNMSADPEQEYLGDGLAEDLITTLSKISNLFVIARNSSFAYKGKAVDIRDVARELGVRHVLEGSVRSSGQRLRITAQLIDAVDGHHVWAERYDRQLEDVFDIQDEMTREIVTALRLKLSDGEQSQVWLRGTEDFDAWLKTMQALELVMQGSPAEVAQARDLFQSAVEADPDYTFALAWIGMTHWFDVRFGFSESPEKSLAMAGELAEEALRRSPLDAHSHHIAGLVLSFRERYDEALAELREAIRLSPNDALLKAGLGRVLIFAGRAEEAEPHLREAMRLNPFYPNYYLGVLANALEQMGRDDEAIAVLRSAIARAPNYFAGHLRLASLLGLGDSTEDAEAETKEVLRINPRFDLSRAASFYPTANPDFLARFVSGLRKAGLPE
ncbi:MAG: adenylate/guanylate cyclase domain-containing protein [Alphaproteobacteria bacterium]